MVAATRDLDCDNDVSLTSQSCYTRPGSPSARKATSRWWAGLAGPGSSSWVIERTWIQCFLFCQIGSNGFQPSQVGRCYYIRYCRVSQSKAIKWPADWSVIGCRHQVTTWLTFNRALGVKINGVFKLRGAAGSENCRGVEIIRLESNRTAFKRQTHADGNLCKTRERRDGAKQEEVLNDMNPPELSGSVINRLREPRFHSRQVQFQLKRHCFQGGVCVTRRKTAPLKPAVVFYSLQVWWVRDKCEFVRKQHQCPTGAQSRWRPQIVWSQLFIHQSMCQFKCQYTGFCSILAQAVTILPRAMKIHVFHGFKKKNLYLIS